MPAKRSDFFWCSPNWTISSSSSHLWPTKAVPASPAFPLPVDGFIAIG
jgi:hypothetical protein